VSADEAPLPSQETAPEAGAPDARGDAGAAPGFLAFRYPPGNCVSRLLVDDVALTYAMYDGLTVAPGRHVIVAEGTTLIEWGGFKKTVDVAPGARVVIIVRLKPSVLRTDGVPADCMLTAKSDAEDEECFHYLEALNAPAYRSCMSHGQPGGCGRCNVGAVPANWSGLLGALALVIALATRRVLRASKRPCSNGKPGFVLSSSSAPSPTPSRSRRFCRPESPR
jgi:hypothetical protein